MSKKNKLMNLQKHETVDLTEEMAEVGTEESKKPVDDKEYLKHRHDMAIVLNNKCGKEI